MENLLNVEFANALRSRLSESLTDRYPLSMLDARYFEARDADGYIKLDAYSD
jgi:hypothetical protein